MTCLGYPGTFYFIHVRDYINDLRNMLGTDWAYPMFIVDSSNDADGRFTDNKFAYAYLRGPFLVITYDNNWRDISNMDRVTAHETCHMFYATDEYNDKTEYSGYLNVADVDGSGCLMDTSAWALSSGTRGQLGWRDTDGDGIQGIVDTFPDTTLNPHVSDLTTDIILTYTGSVIEVPYAKGSGYPVNTEVAIYNIPDGYDLTPSNAKTVTCETTEAHGTLAITLVWEHPLDLGEI